MPLEMETVETLEAAALQFVARRTGETRRKAHSHAGC